MSKNKALKNKKTLFKTMFGSRLYGTNTPQSDIDWKEIFLPDVENLLIGKKPSNIVVSTGSDHLRNSKDDVDNEYIPIQVFANDFLAGQTYAIELAFAALSDEFLGGQDIQSTDFLDFVYELVDKFLTSNIRAMIGYAMNQAQIYGIKGTRLASVRKFTDYLKNGLDNGTLKPTDKLAVLEEWVIANTDKYFFMSTFETMDTRFPAISILEKLYPLTTTVQETHGRMMALKDKYGSRAQDAEAAKGMDWKATAHAVRITQQAIKLLRDHTLDFPFAQSNIDLLLSIKHGELSEDTVKSMLEQLFDELDSVKEITTLQDRSPELDEKFEEWLKEWMVFFYDRE
jgi:hypothetical protein